MLETDHQRIEKLERQVDLLVGIGGLPLAIRIALYLDNLANDSYRMADTLVDLDLIGEQLKVRLRAVLAKGPDATQYLVEFLDARVNKPTAKIPSFTPGRRIRRRRSV
ncbi:MAG: hypothetical protein WCD34_09385 [Candidatus Acidiferrum sp.]